MGFFTTSVTGLKTVVTAIGAGVGVWGVINLLEGYGNDNPGAKSQGIKHLMSSMDHFELVSQYKPTGDQPQAIEDLVKGFKEGNQCQTLLGVTGSGKTFTMANVIQQINKPTLVIAHNKTLAAQLYGEFKEFFPNNAVEYFVS